MCQVSPSSTAIKTAMYVASHGVYSTVVSADGTDDVVLPWLLFFLPLEVLRVTSEDAVALLFLFFLFPSPLEPLEGCWLFRFFFTFFPPPLPFLPRLPFLPLGDLVVLAASATLADAGDTLSGCFFSPGATPLVSSGAES